MRKLIIKIIELIIIIVTIILTQSATDCATSLRHYIAYGGEYLIPVIGCVVLSMVNGLKN